MSEFKILSFDPGLTTLGWAFNKYNTETSKMTVLKYGSYKSTKVAMKDKEMCNIYGHRMIALNLLEEEVCRLIDSFKPDYIASEDIFLHIRHVNAFAALTLCLHSMRRAAYTRKMTIYTMAPCDIKKVTASTGHADKEAIQKSILENPNIEIIENKQIPLDKMVEHEADAISVGYAFSTVTLQTLLLEMSEPIVDKNVTLETKTPKKLRSSNKK